MVAHGLGIDGFSKWEGIFYTYLLSRCITPSQCTWAVCCLPAHQRANLAIVRLDGSHPRHRQKDLTGCDPQCWEDYSYLEEEADPYEAGTRTPEYFTITPKKVHIIGDWAETETESSSFMWLYS